MLRAQMATGNRYGKSIINNAFNALLQSLLRSSLQKILVKTRYRPIVHLHLCTTVFIYHSYSIQDFKVEGDISNPAHVPCLLPPAPQSQEGDGVHGEAFSFLLLFLKKYCSSRTGRQI
jgi:hypothetical protein